MNDEVRTENPGRTGVLIVGFGGPDSIEAVRPFLCELTGREPSDETVDEVCTRYLAIGGQSPLVETANSMAAALATELEKRTGGWVPVRVGMRYSARSISDAVATFIDEGVERIVTCSLSPFESKVTHEAYREAVAEAIDDSDGVEVVELPPIGTMIEFAELVAASAMSSLQQLEPATGALVVFTAHSLPVADLIADDPYVGGLTIAIDRACEFLHWEHGREGAGEPLLPGIEAYGSVSGGPQPWVLAYQSKGKRPGAWLGPSLDDVIDAAHTANVPSIVVVPAGFVTDHLETLYDLDIEAAGRALDYDMEYVRGPVANDHEHLITGLAEAIHPLL